MVEGLRLLVVGMGAVFAFLGLLVGSMHLAAAFFQANAAWFPEPARGPEDPGDADAAIAVAVAVAAHRAAGGR